MSFYSFRVHRASVPTHSINYFHSHRSLGSSDFGVCCYRCTRSRNKGPISNLTLQICRVFFLLEYSILVLHKLVSYLPGNSRCHSSRHLDHHSQFHEKKKLLKPEAQFLKKLPLHQTWNQTTSEASSEHHSYPHQLFVAATNRYTLRLSQYKLIYLSII